MRRSRDTNGIGAKHASGDAAQREQAKHAAQGAMLEEGSSTRW